MNPVLITKNQLRQRAGDLVGKSFDHKLNCFCVSEFFYRDTELRQYTADEMLDFVAENFQQVSEQVAGALTLVWSRSSLELAIGQIRVTDLVKRELGFPFGLILEHSFVQLDSLTVFQKPDPSTSSKIELTSLAAAMSPYSKLNGFEVTLHVPKIRF